MVNKPSLTAIADVTFTLQAFNNCRIFSLPYRYSFLFVHKCSYNSLLVQRFRVNLVPRASNLTMSLSGMYNGSPGGDRRTKKETVYLGMFKAKILVLGPCESGKTVITNFLSDATETSGGEYHPTQGVRILEFESSGIEISPGKTANCEVELWDCSGNHKFSTCWAAFQKDTNGVLIIYNPDQSSHDKELETWYTQFVQSQGLKDSQCMVFAHRRPSAADTTRSQIPSVLSRVKCIQTNLDEEPETVRDEFHNFLAKVISNWTDKRDQEELSIMNT